MINASQSALVLLLALTFSQTSGQSSSTDTLTPYKIIRQPSKSLILFSNTNVPLYTKSKATLKKANTAITGGRAMVIRYNKTTMSVLSSSLVPALHVDSTAMVDSTISMPEMMVVTTPLTQTIPIDSLQFIIDYFKSLACRPGQPCSRDNPCIPFTYKDNGCNARAHIMRLKLAEIFSYDCQKIFVESGQTGSLTVNSPDNCGPTGACVIWAWHIAICVTARNADGTTVKKVIDPSLFSVAVTPEEWVNAQRQACGHARIGDAGAYQLGPPNQNSPNGHLDNITETRKLLYKFCKSCH